VSIDSSCVARVRWEETIFRIHRGGGGGWASQVLIFCFGSLWTGDNEESYMYRANTAWSNVDPVPTDAELDTR
jgi:hypothetical protein